jgi:hypothetical protein
MGKKDKLDISTRNWYETPLLKKYIQKTHNPNFHLHDISIPMRSIIVGCSGSGKTQLLLDLLNAFQHTFEKVDIVVRNIQEPIYMMLIDKFKDKGLVVHEGIEHLPKLDSYNIVVLDDLALESAKAQLPISEFYIRCRKLGVSIVYLSQSYFAIPRVIRLNVNYIFLKKIASTRELFDIVKTYSLCVDKAVMKSMYTTATEKKSDFLLIDLEGDTKKRFKLNFDQVFQIPEEDDEECSVKLVPK